MILPLPEEREGVCPKLEAWPGEVRVHQEISHRDFPRAASSWMWVWPAVHVFIIVMTGQGHTPQETGNLQGKSLHTKQQGLNKNIWSSNWPDISSFIEKLSSLTCKKVSINMYKGGEGGREGRGGGSLPSIRTP